MEAYGAKWQVATHHAISLVAADLTNATGTKRLLAVLDI